MRLPVTKTKMTARAVCSRWIERVGMTDWLLRQVRHATERVTAHGDWLRIIGAHRQYRTRIRSVVSSVLRSRLQASAWSQQQGSIVSLYTR